MILLLVVFALAAVVLPPLARRLGRSAFLVAALVPLAGFVHALVLVPSVTAGAVVTESVRWVPSLDLAISVRLDALSLLLALIVTGVGSLVLVYCAAYFRRGDPGVPRFVGTLVAFAGAMYGLVIADDAYLLFVFWEATSVFSYLLIGQTREKRASRNAALQALLVTTLGGLVMLVGLVLLSLEAGTSSISGILAAAPTGDLVTVAVALVLVGILSKSAVFPFHFWLPGAMAAPTPVSAYLHAAAMVKAGIYLAARLAPGFADVPGWRETLAVLGIASMLLGGVIALAQTDLKLLLAYGTVSQLGFLVAVAGWGTAESALAAGVLLLSHALFKSALFLIVGIVDHGCGTRDLRKLTGFGRRAPLLAGAATLAVLSMAGVPPLLGFIAKEAVLTALIDDGTPLAWAVLAGVVIGSALTVAYGVRFIWGAFATKAGVPPLPPETGFPRGETWVFFSSPVLLAASGLVLGLAPMLIDAPLQQTVAGYPRADELEHLALWHGLQPALLFSGLALAAGGVLAWLVARRLPRDEPAPPLAARAYGATLRAVDRVAAVVTGLTQRGSLPFYLAVIFVVALLAVGAAVTRVTQWPAVWTLAQNPAQPVIGLLMAGAAIATTLAGKRFQAVVLVGVTGIGMAALFALQGAPDLALTQVLVEVVTLVTVVLVLRRLPARLGDKHGTTSRLPRAILGVAVGLMMALVALVATAARLELPISQAWAELAVEGGHGKNVVNVALVDLRGWDTMGELSVVIAAATGVASLIFLRTRTDDLPRTVGREARRTLRARRHEGSQPRYTPADRSSWLLAGRTLAPENRSILLEVVVRLLFHPLMLVSLYLLLVGHNAPGGGFAGGLVAGLALVGRYLAGGRVELGAAAPFDAGKLLGIGLILAVGTALLPLFFGVDALTSTWFAVPLGPLGEIDFVTSTVFDIGVYLVVIGLVLDVLRSLGAEVDRQYEASNDTAGGTAGTAATGAATPNEVRA
jgi:multicomponent Na+:H+ antiporter subunit A